MQLVLGLLVFLLLVSNVAARSSFTSPNSAVFYLLGDSSMEAHCCYEKNCAYR